MKQKVSKEKILNEAREYAEQAKKGTYPAVKYTLKSGGTSSLGKVIKTQEQADFFMKMLRSL
ncbi:hypothetical protein [Paraflavitalea sp. CAU 1676]|uniref:hypothetical protein n=1 Tax=Paraflavitalea sp. CAU 1676 TaxID=3032598 RepID=UPI0023DB0AA2|nr:hypothetical protein [Paraflavitalea sp. CAU 1676]MDF2193312.1 hypothetical protein [Paraflavitalea sp. CAU 1676]